MKLSIKARITLWYAALLVTICLAAMLVLFAASRHAQTVYCRDTLTSAMVVIRDELEIEHDLVEIDTDIDEVPNVYAALFDLEGNLIYGRRRVQAPFEQGTMRAVEGDGPVYDPRVLSTMTGAGTESFARRESVAVGVFAEAARAMEDALASHTLDEVAIDEYGPVDWNAIVTQK
jgi:hypothetical protein